jgi:hypothetical protein
VALSQLGNALLAGDPDETICSRVAKSRLRGGKWGRWLIPIVERLDPRPDHFGRSIEEDEGSDQVR